MNAMSSSVIAWEKPLPKTSSTPAVQVMAFGDGLNDISMIREAGIGVAMQNAVEEVKSAADLITGSCEESGVAEVVERLLVV